MAELDSAPTSSRPYLGKVVLDISIKSSGWTSLGVNIHQHCQKIAEAVISHVTGDDNIRNFIEVSLLLADDKSLYNLNKEYRNKNKPTNVLSFPFLKNSKNEVLNMVKSKSCTFLGDIAISYARIMEESLQQEKRFIEYFTYILIHGILHLFKYDHIIDEEAEIMEKMEIKIMKFLKLRSCRY